MWAVPSSAGAGMTKDLPKVLDTFRADVSASLAHTLRRRQVRERKANDALLVRTKRAWKSLTKKMPTESELRESLRMIHVAVFDS